ncbi:type 1 glutamine amidotransferase domain-containing protein [Labilibaculum sp.]|uniref:type 1 glutamine amidotransferase domain-containing protein n=1 Tax=Labilibaculum sp. TaxID=2060723 RepID=UPI00356875E7
MSLTTGVLKILFVLTSHSQMGDTGHKTGFWVEEFANPYYTLIDQGVEVTLATPKGGGAPIDPTSNLPQNATEDTKRFNKDKAVQKKIANTLALADVNFEDYDAVFYPGGHGPLWDLAEDATSAKLIQDFNEAKKPIAFVCHAPAALKNVKDTFGESLVKGKKVTGFSNEEEEAVQLTKVVPFLVEDMLKANGGIYSRGDNWTAYAVEDGNLITGQNPASSALVAQMLLKKLQEK